jgi:hypothetical protein
LPTIVQDTVGGKLTVTFPAVRGGVLSVKAEAVIGTQHLNVISHGVRIIGTNPPLGTLHAAFPHDSLRRIARHESGCRQFDAAANGGTSGCPLFSSDGLGGVGIMQITNPRPSDDEVWSWQANVQRGVQIFNGKRGIATRYPAQVRQSHRFQQLVVSFNADRAAHQLPPLQVTLPDFTSTGFGVAPANLGQVELDMIRGFNGWAGRDAFGFVLHEFRVQLDAQGRLIVDVIPNTARGNALWEQVPARDRPQTTGDPNYVQRVLGAQPC